MPHEIRFTREAAHHAREIDVWWKTNRPAAPELFGRELQATVRRLQALPGIGRAFDDWPGIRRVLLLRCRYHVYYAVLPAEQVVEIRAVWHSARGQGPFG